MLVHTLICFLIIYPILFPVTYCQFVRVQGRSKLSELKQNSNFPDCKVAHFLLAMTCNFQASSPRLSLIPPPYMYYNIFLARALYNISTLVEYSVAQATDGFIFKQLDYNKTLSCFDLLSLHKGWNIINLINLKIIFYKEYNMINRKFLLVTFCDRFNLFVKLCPICKGKCAIQLNCKLKEGQCIYFFLS